MQPYFFPYAGYFQLIAAVDLMVLVSDFPYLKGGFVNRNRMIVNGVQNWLTLPVSKASPNKSIEQHQVCLDSSARSKTLQKIRQAYAKAAHLREVMGILEGGLPPNGSGLASALWGGLHQCGRALQISTPMQMINACDIAPGSSGEQRVLEICRHFGAKEYLNLPGGRALYSPQVFANHGIRLGFIEPEFIAYSQINTLAFVPKLSILDLLMNVKPSSRPHFLNPLCIDWAGV